MISTSTASASIKLKGGVFPPEQEIEAIRALREAFPDHPLRLDPNAAWSTATSIRVAEELDGVLEYLEDPTPEISGHGARWPRKAPMPLATNMCVVAFDHLRAVGRAGRRAGASCPTTTTGAACSRSRQLAVICETFGIGLSMHSNSHLGI